MIVISKRGLPQGLRDIARAAKGLFIALAAMLAVPSAKAQTNIAAAPNGGYWVQVYEAYGNTKTLAVDGAPEFESVPENGFVTTVPGGVGYWVVTPQGKIYNRGDAPVLCNGDLTTCSGFRPGNGSKPLAAVAATPDGGGFWAVGQDGAVWTAGTAQSYGDVLPENKYPTGIAPTPSGKGYYIVIEDGGVYSFGDAKFYGSTGGSAENINGIALSRTAHGDVNGYWLIGGDGGVLTFGTAIFLGSTGGNNGGSTVTAITAGPQGRNYAWVHANGRVQGSSNFLRAYIKSFSSGLVWQAPEGGDPAGTRLVMENTSSGDLYQQWIFWRPTSASEGFQLYNLGTGLCADANPTPEGSVVIQLACQPLETSGNQLFQIFRDTRGAVALQKVNRPGASILALPALDVGGHLWLKDASSPYAIWDPVPEVAIDGVDYHKAGRE